MRGVAAVLACFAIVALMLASSRWLAGRQPAAVGHLLLGAAAGAGAALLFPLAAHLATYSPRLAQQQIAEVHFEQLGARRYRATLTRLPGGQVQVLETPGDEWRIDARTLAWEPRLAGLGMGPAYRLDRLGTRATRPPGEPEAPLASYALGDETGRDVWTKAHAGTRWSRVVDARRAYGPWRPMANGARFSVQLRDTGVEVAPANEAAVAAMQARQRSAVPARGSSATLGHVP